MWSSLEWRNNGRDSVSNNQSHDGLLNRLFRRRSKKTSKLRVTGLCAVNSPGTGEFPAQMVSNAENVSIGWRHHGVQFLHDHQRKIKQYVYSPLIPSVFVPSPTVIYVFPFPTSRVTCIVDGSYYDEIEQIMFAGHYRELRVLLIYANRVTSSRWLQMAWCHTGVRPSATILLNRLQQYCHESYCTDIILQPLNKQWPREFGRSSTSRFPSMDK